ncbi:MAG: hypothetical protein V4620_05080 [Bacteroidota bacterium]
MKIVQLFNKNMYCCNMNKLLLEIDSLQSESKKFESCMHTEIPKIVELYYDTFKSLLKFKQGRHNNDPRFNAMYMSSIMSEKIETLFGSKIYKMKFGTLSLNKDNEYRILFKKLNNSMMPSYNHTRNSRRLLNQQYELNLPQSKIVYIGYTVNNSWEKITQINAVYICNNQIYWNLDLIKSAYQINNSKQQNNINIIRDEDIKVEVKVKSQKKDQTG